MPFARPPINLLSVVANVERHNLSSDEPVLLLLDLAWPGTDPVTDEHVRFVRDLNPITFDANDGCGPQEYTPFNFMLGEFMTSSNGSVPDVEVQASNVMRALQTTIEQYAGVVGAALSLYAVSTANPAGEPDLTLSFTVKQTVSDAKLVHFKCGASSPLRRLFPLSMYRPNYCVWDYNSPALQAATATAIAAGTPLKDPRGAQCGYIGSMTTCSKTIDGATGCIAHNNLVRILTFPGIDSNGASVATVA